MIPYGQSYTSTVSGSILRTTKCEQCDIEYGYMLHREASGQGSSLLFLDNSGAAQRASEAAQFNLFKELQKGVALTPCPRCGWIQRDMLRLARRQYHTWLKMLGIALVVIGALLFGWSLLTQSSLWAQLAIAVGAAAALTPILHYLITLFHDPNNANELEARREAGNPVAVWGLPLDPENDETCPSCKSPRGRNLKRCLECSAPLHEIEPTGKQINGPKHPDAKHLWAFLGVVVIVLGWFTNVILRQNEAKAAQLVEQGRIMAPFQDRVTEFLPNNPKHAAEPRPIKGKIITVDRSGKHVDNVYFALPENLRAATPDDVATIVWLQWGKDIVGQYGIVDAKVFGGVITCQVTVIDKESGEILHEREFVGGQPPDTTEARSGTIYGSSPAPHIAVWLGYLTQPQKKTKQKTDAK